MSKFQASPQQQGFFDWIANDTGNAILEAVAGAGKSTTLVEGLRYMLMNNTSSISIYLGAFNKAIAEELKAKVEKMGLMQRGLSVSTMHSAGFSACRFRWKSVKVDHRKVASLIENMASVDQSWEPVLGYMSFVTKMVSFAKQFLAGVRHGLVGVNQWSDIQDLSCWQALCDHFDADSDLPENVKTTEALSFAARALEMSNKAVESHQVIDFDDMIYVPLMFNLRIWKNTWVLGDEWQDASPARIELARRMLAPNGRFVAVGDPHQAIYGFAGATNDALEITAKTFRCVRLPLTVTYRCPKAVVLHAQQYVKHIQAHPNAPEGLVRQVVYDSAKQDPVDLKPVPWYMQDHLTSTDAILCRYTKPLVATAFGMIRRGVACKIEGRDVGNGLIALATRWKVKSLAALEKRLDAWEAREVAKAQKAKSDRREQEAHDKADTLRVFIERAKAKDHQATIDAVIADIRLLFADNVSGVTTLASIHRSKGREWKRVYWLQAAIRGLNRMQPWEQEQETNLNYVSTTRAMSELVLVPENIQ